MSVEDTKVLWLRERSRQLAAKVIENFADVISKPGKEVRTDLFPALNVIGEKDEEILQCVL